jgi:hypothetical protein
VTAYRDGGAQRGCRGPHGSTALLIQTHASVQARLFDAAAAALLRMPQARFDTQSVATALNALAARGRFDAPLFRHLAAAVLAPRDG